MDVYAGVISKNQCPQDQIPPKFIASTFIQLPLEKYESIAFLISYGLNSRQTRLCSLDWKPV